MIDCVKTVDTILFFICPCLPQRQGSPQKLQISLIFVSYIYITSFIVVITPPFKTFTPPNMYMFLTPPIRRCFFCAFLYFVGAIIGRRCLFFYHHPSVGFADSSPLWEPYKMPLLEERWHAVTEWWQTISRHTSYVLLTYPL